MELEGRKELVDTGKSSRTWSVPTVSRHLAVLNVFQGFFGQKMAVFGAKRAVETEVCHLRTPFPAATVEFLAQTSCDCTSHPYTVVVHRVDHLVARLRQLAPWPGQGRIAAAQGHTMVLRRVDHRVAHWSQPAPGLGQGRTSAAHGHAVVVRRVDHRVAHLSQPALAPGQGPTAAAQRHAVVVRRVDHVVARTSQPAPGLGQGRTAAAQGHALVARTVDHRVAHPSQPARGREQGRTVALRGTRWLWGGLTTLWRDRVSRRQGRDKGE